MRPLLARDPLIQMVPANLRVAFTTHARRRYHRILIFCSPICSLQAQKFKNDISEKLKLGIIILNQTKLMVVLAGMD